MTFKAGTMIFNAEGQRAAVDLDRRDKGGRLWAIAEESWRKDKRRAIDGEWLEVNDDNADLLDFIDSIPPEREPYWKESGRNRVRRFAFDAYRRIVFAARAGTPVSSWRDLEPATGLTHHEISEMLGSRGANHEIGYYGAFLEDKDGHAILGDIGDTPGSWTVVTVRGPDGELKVGPPETPWTALDVLREIKPKLSRGGDAEAGESFAIVAEYLAGLDREAASDD